MVVPQDAIEQTRSIPGMEQFEWTKWDAMCSVREVRGGIPSIVLKEFFTAIHWVVRNDLIWQQLEPHTHEFTDWDDVRVELDRVADAGSWDVYQAKAGL